MSQLSLFDQSGLARKSDPQTSVDAATAVEPKLSGLRAEFVQRLRDLGVPSTANEVAAGKESIRKRAAECVKLGFCVELGTKFCSVTQMKATVYWVKQ